MDRVRGIERLCRLCLRGIERLCLRGIVYGGSSERYSSEHSYDLHSTTIRRRVRKEVMLIRAKFRS